jgi:hypothetical protein
MRRTLCFDPACHTLVGTQSKENAMGLREGDKIRVVGTVRTEFVGSDGIPTLEIEVDGHYIFARRDMVELVEPVVVVGDDVLSEGFTWTVLAIDGDWLWCKPKHSGTGSILPNNPTSKPLRDVTRVEKEAGQ